jgi:hypothetical protein
MKNLCPKCNGQMELGEVQRATWISVSPKASAWERAKRTLSSARIMQGQRCSKCGYLELYVR